MSDKLRSILTAGIPELGGTQSQIVEDALAVALGWEKVLIPDGTPSGESDEYWCSGERNNREIHQRIEYWNPTQDILCAFQVIDAMRKKGWFAQIDNGLVGIIHETDDYKVSFRKGGITRTETGLTAEIAICKAVLRALAV